MVKKLNDNLNYRKFVNERDDALERILANNRRRIAELMDKAFTKVLEVVKLRYDLSKSPIHHFQRTHTQSIELELTHIFEKLGIDIFGEIVDLRKKTFLLSYLGEFRAIHNVAVSSSNPKLTRHELDNKSLDAKFSGDVDPIRKITYSLTKIKQDVMNAIQFSLIHDETVDQAIGRVFLALPKTKRIPKKASLKRVKATEADRDFNFGLNIDLTKRPKNWAFEIDPETWQALVDDYKNEYIPEGRGPTDFFDIKNPWNDNPIREDIPEGDKFYSWEVQRDIANDFVSQVRAGQIEAANQNGIDEFVVIAQVDESTCDKCCGGVGCIDFHGKLTSEVEEMTDGEFSAPPYHFCCRCSLAPASKDLEYKPEFTEEDFNQWLNS